MFCAHEMMMTSILWMLSTCRNGIPSPFLFVLFLPCYELTMALRMYMFKCYIMMLIEVAKIGSKKPQLLNSQAIHLWLMHESFLH